MESTTERQVLQARTALSHASGSRGELAGRSVVRGTVTYDDQFGHVCTCTEAVTCDAEGYPEHASYLPTVTADRASGTETGSFWYSCSRCGAGAWSGC